MIKWLYKISQSFEKTSSIFRKKQKERKNDFKLEKSFNNAASSSLTSFIGVHTSYFSLIHTIFYVFSDIFGQASER